MKWSGGMLTYRPAYTMYPHRRPIEDYFFNKPTEDYQILWRRNTVIKSGLAKD